MTTIVLWSLAGLLAGVLIVLAVQAVVFRDRVGRARQAFAAAGGGPAVTRGDLAGLPAPAVRFLRRALPDAGPLATAVELDLEQRVRIQKLDPKSPFHIYRMCMVLAAGRGLTATGWLRNGTPTSVLFWYSRGEGAIREALFDLIPTVGRSGPEVAKTLRGRALGDLFFLPTAFLPQNGAVWEAIDDERALVTVSLDGDQLPITLRIDPEGRLLEVTVKRWATVGVPNGGYAMIPFGMTVEEEKSFGGYTIPSRLRGGWWYETERYLESLQLQVDGATFS